MCFSVLLLRHFFGYFGKMKLTRRQELFVHNLLDLYRESNGPIHYSTLAERVGVSPFTAYDMLRLLEEKGFVVSEYRIDTEKPITGRSEVFFSPTDLARQRLNELSSGAEFEDWEEVKFQILTRIRVGEFKDRDLAEELLARIPPNAPDALRFCYEVLTIIALRLVRGRSRHILSKRLPQLLAMKGMITRSNLLVLGGFMLGLLAEENPGDFEADQPILRLVERYQILVMNMEPRLCHRLGEDLREMFTLLLKSQKFA